MMKGGLLKLLLDGWKVVML